MKKCLFFMIFCVAMFAVGCSDPHKNLEDFPEIIPDEPEIVMPEDPIQDASSNSDEPSVEPEVEEFEFDVSKLTPTKYPDAVEDPSLLSLNPTVVRKGNLIDVEISYGNENANGYCGRAYIIEVFIDGNWYDIVGDYKSFVPEQYWDSTFAFNEDAVPLFQINRQTIPMTTSFENLPIGRYRVVKELNGWKYAEFEIVDSKDLNFDVSKLISTQYPEATEDLTLFFVESTILSKDNMVDLTMTFGKEGYGTVDDSMFYVGPYCGYDYTLEVYIDGTWYSIFGDVEKFVPAEYLSKWEESFTFPAGIIPLNRVSTKSVPTGTVLSGLPVGRYRIVKDVDGWKYAEFVIE